MKTLAFLLVAFLAINIGFGVDRNNFKTCEQSGFCNRLRKFKPEKSQYAMNIDTAIIHDNVLTAEVNTVDTSTEKNLIIVSCILFSLIKNY